MKVLNPRFNACNPKLEYNVLLYNNVYNVCIYIEEYKCV